MDIISKSEFTKLVEKGEIFVNNYDKDNSFKDDFRFKFHIEDKLISFEQTTIHLDKLDEIKIISHEVRNLKLQPNSHYLAVSRERLRLPSNVIGYLYTSSKYARLGLEMLQSSNIINPNFGKIEPEPITFEISVKIPIEGLSSNNVYCYGLFFRLKKSTMNIPTPQNDKYPFLF